MDRKRELEVLGKRFGRCGCEDRCQMEQYGESGAETKPNGRFSVCDLEVEKVGAKVPKKAR